MGAKLKSNKYCQQYFDVIEMMQYGCSYNACSSCGHNVSVARYRKLLIRNVGLKQGEDGLYRLILPKKGKRKYVRKSPQEK